MKLFMETPVKSTAWWQVTYWSHPFDQPLMERHLRSTPEVPLVCPLPSLHPGLERGCVHFQHHCLPACSWSLYEWNSWVCICISAFFYSAFYLGFIFVAFSCRVFVTVAVWHRNQILELGNSGIAALNHEEMDWFRVKGMLPLCLKLLYWPSSPMLSSWLFRLFLYP